MAATSGRQHRTRGLVLLVLVALAVPLGAEPDDRAIDAKERGRRERRLGIIALRFMTARKRFPSRCPRCEGSGKWLTKRGRKRVYVQCKQCAGNGAWVSDKHYKIVHFDMRTPAFQRLPGIQDLLDREYKAARAGKPWPRRMARIRIKRVELIDATHAIAWVGIDADKVPTETRWIWIVRQGKKKGEWFAYDVRSDGRWPGNDARQQIETLSSGDWDALTPDEHRSVREAVVSAGLTFRSIEYRKRGAALLVRLVPRKAYNGARALAYVGGDAVKLSHAVFRRVKGWQDVESEWLTDWEDPWGRVTTKPAWSALLTRSQFDATAWNDLQPQAQIDVLKWNQFEHDGWTPFDADSSEAAKESEPAPRQEHEPETEPEPRAEPERKPPPTVPRPPSEPEPELDPNFTIPKLTRKAQKTGDAAVAEIQTLFARANDVNKEGALARSEGAHSLWQEKLAQVRSILGEIEDLWTEKIVPAMPGRDDLERDLVANHYFGDIWGDLDRLKAAVRKVSSTH